MTGRIDIFIPRTADGDLMTGPVPKHRLPNVRSIDVRTFFDPLADRNQPNAIPVPKAKPMPAYAPRGWRLRPAIDVTPIPEVQGPPEPVGCPRCGRTFRKSGAGLAWHVAKALDCAARSAA